MKKLLLYMICLTNIAIYAEFEKVTAENIASMPPQKVRNAFANTADYKDIEFTNLQAVEFKIKQATTKAATTLQNAARTYQKNQALKEQALKDKHQTKLNESQNQAATDIQRIFKGMQARKETEKLRNQAKAAAAALKEQTVWDTEIPGLDLEDTPQPTTPEAAKGDEIEKLIKQLKELRGKQRKSQGSAKKQIDTTINDLRETILKINPNFKEEAPKSKAKKGKRNN